MIILNQEDFASCLHPQQPPKSAYWCSEVFPFWKHTRHAYKV